MKPTKTEKELYRTRALVTCMLRAIQNLGFDAFARIDARIQYRRYKKRWEKIKKECS